MNKTGIVIILLCFLAAIATVLWERRKVRKTMEEIERMLDAAMTGSFSETNFDESQLSALETKFAHYLSAAEILIVPCSVYLMALSTILASASAVHLKSNTAKASVSCSCKDNPFSETLAAYCSAIP